jgi:predicted transcriptional regulator
MASPTSLRLPPEIEAAMKELAKQHDRSINSEIIQACKAWIEAERNKDMSKVYTFSYEIGGAHVVTDEIKVEGVSEQRAREHAEMALEDKYPGEEDNLLLELTLQDVAEWDK